MQIKKPRIDRSLKYPMRPSASSIKNTIFTTGRKAKSNNKGRIKRPTRRTKKGEIQHPERS
jgi:hypothetical protein